MIQMYRKQSKRLINDNTESVLNFKHLSEAFSQTSFDILRTSRKIKERNEIVNMRKWIMSNDRIVTKLPRFWTPLASKILVEIKLIRETDEWEYKWRKAKVNGFKQSYKE